MLFRRPLTLLAVGLAAIALDLRVVQVDLLPDVTGWLLVAGAAWALSAWPPAVLAAGVAVASAPDAFLSRHYDAIDPLSGEVVANPAANTAYRERLAFDRVTDARAVAAVVTVCVGTIAVLWVLGVVARRASRGGDDHAARLIGVGRWLVVLAWAVPQLLVWTFQWTEDGGIDPVWNGTLELAALAGLAAVIAVVALLAVRRNRGWAVIGEDRVAPWASRMGE